MAQKKKEAAKYLETGKAARLLLPGLERCDSNNISVVSARQALGLPPILKLNHKIITEADLKKAHTKIKTEEEKNKDFAKRFMRGKVTTTKAPVVVEQENRERTKKRTQISKREVSSLLNDVKKRDKPKRERRSTKT